MTVRSPAPAVATLALVLAGMPAACSAAPPAPLDLCDYKPAFMEEFDTDSIASHRVDPARWTAHTPWNGDFGDAAFTDPGPGGPFSVKDGILRITASRRRDGRWTSGLIAAADPTGAGSGVQYGYFEARMKFPAGPGTWPAFWLSTLKPDKAPGPGIEVDVVEFYGHSTAAYQAAVHVWYPKPRQPEEKHHGIAVPADSLVDGWHSYGVRIAPDLVTFFLDRKPVWETPTPPELTQPVFPLVDLALGSGFPIDKTPDPSTMLVDYVHVYAADPAGRLQRCAAAKAP